AYFNVFNWYKGVSTPVYDVLPDLSVVQRTPITFFGGTKTIPRDRPQQIPLVAYLDSPTGIGLAAGNGIAIAIVILTWIYLFAARNQPSVRSLSFPFLSLICVGCVLVLASNIAALGSPTSVGCQTSLWLFCWGLELVLASSAAKAYRLWRIFDNKMISAGKVGNKYLFAGVLGVILGQTIILIIWTAGGPQQAIMVSSRTYYFYRCESA
ncbi:7 transmembrane sweet-taste receptor of 3 GCPR-domain-containing protein, partial [Catenaria anguillulae PL171]